MCGVIRVFYIIMERWEIVQWLSAQKLKLKNQAQIPTKLDCINFTLMLFGKTQVHIFSPDLWRTF